MKQDIKALQAAVAGAELIASLSQQPNLKAEIMRIIAGVDNQSTDIRTAADNIVELINGQAVQLKGVAV